MKLNSLRAFLVLIYCVVLGACASVTVAPDQCPEGTQKLEGCPPIGAIDDSEIAELYAQRTWTHHKELDGDPIEYGRDARIPINHARAKFIGSTDEDGLVSLAAEYAMQCLMGTETGDKSSHCPLEIGEDCYRKYRT